MKPLMAVAMAVALLAGCQGSPLPDAPQARRSLQAAAGEWTFTSDAPTARLRPATATGLDGRIYVIGGEFVWHDGNPTVDA